MMGRGLLAVACAALTAGVVIAATAFAAPGLSVLGCVEDEESASQGECTEVSGMRSPSGLGVSPSGQSAYVTSGGDDALIRFSRASNGALSFAECLQDDEALHPASQCTELGLALSGAGAGSALAVAATTGGVDTIYTGQPEGVSTFTRAPGGGLAGGSCISDDDFEDECAVTSPSLLGPRDMGVSPDGASLYVVADAVNQPGLTELQREPATGALTPGQCFRGATSVETACDDGVHGSLDGPRALAISPAGDNVYVAAGGVNAIAIFDRETAPGPSRGDLTYVSCIEDAAANGDNCDEVTGANLDDVQGLSVSPDGAHLYAASGDDSTVTTLSRNQASGTLAVSGCVGDTGSAAHACPITTLGLRQPLDVIVNAAGTRVYSAAIDDNAVAAFARNSATGALTPLGCVDAIPQFGDACDIEDERLGSPQWLALSPDGGTLYSTSLLSYRVAWFGIGSAAGTTMCAGKPATQVGGGGADVLTGTAASDVIVGLGGNDTIKGLGGNDRLCGLGGKDTILAGGGKDVLMGDEGADRLNGGPGRDKCVGGPGKDRAKSCERRQSI